MSKHIIPGARATQERCNRRKEPSVPMSRSCWFLSLWNYVFALRVARWRVQNTWLLWAEDGVTIARMASHKGFHLNFLNLMSRTKACKLAWPACAANDSVGSFCILDHIWHGKRMRNQSFSWGIQLWDMSAPCYPFSSRPTWLQHLIWFNVIWHHPWSNIHPDKVWVNALRCFSTGSACS